MCEVEMLSFEARIVFLGQCRPMVEAGTVGFSLGRSSLDLFSSSGSLASQSP